MSLQFEDKKGFDLVTLVLPDHSKDETLAAAIKAGACNIVSFGARGHVVSEDDSLFSRIYPPPSPKRGIYQMLIPESKRDYVMRRIINYGHLNISGSGAIFSIACNDVSVSDNYTLWSDRAEESNVGEHEEDESDYTAIVCIVERGAADPIAHSALLAGASGPSVYYAEGRGLRDKIRLLRIAKTAEKEIVYLVVESVDADMVFAEMSKAGRITEPGRGFIYTVPVERGLINLKTTQGSRKSSASMQEVIRAIDELKSGKEWRGYNPIARGASTKLDVEDKPVLKDLVNLTCIIDRDHSDVLMDGILAAGVPATSVSHGYFVKDSVKLAGGKESESSASINKEWSVVQSIISPGLVEKVADTARGIADKEGADGLCMYTFQVPKAQTYLGK